MANAENLIPNSERSPTEVRENSRKGGIASGKKRREKRTIQQILNAVIDGKIDSLPQFAVIARKLGLEDAKNIKEVYTILCLLNTVKTANLGDLERLEKLIGEETTVTANDEEAQKKAHNDLIDALRERKADAD